MKKRIILLLVSLSFVYADVLEVTAERFFGDNKKGVSVLEGDVKITKGDDSLKAEKVTLYTNQEQKLKEIIAEGKVDFMITTPDGRKIKGKSKSLKYNALDFEYRLIGDAYAQEEGKENSINGDEILVNKQTGYINVVGNKDKPAKLIFNLDEVKKDD